VAIEDDVAGGRTELNRVFEEDPFSADRDEAKEVGEVLEHHGPIEHVIVSRCAGRRRGDRDRDHQRRREGDAGKSRHRLLLSEGVWGFRSRG
jgi:hypothetical protein